MFSTAIMAADGDVLRTIIADRTGTNCASTNPAGDHSSVGVGIAFDGSSLFVSCYSDNTITANNPANGALLSVHNITGASSLGAIAWDAGRNLMWACSGFSTVGTVDLTTNVFTTVFSNAPCFDGLAYDSSDDTIWASGDASWPVSHYDLTGAVLGSFSTPAGWSGAGNSGIGVGGDMLYLANNGSSQVYAVDKAGTEATLIFTSDRRQEGLECDNVTFNGIGKTAIWTIDAYDNVLNALEIPYASCSFGGGGEITPFVEVPVPTMSVWAIIAAIALLALFAYGQFRRRIR